MSDLSLGWQRQASTETLNWSFDMIVDLNAGDSLVSAVAMLTDLLTGLSYPAGLSGSPSTSGTVITQTVTGLTAGRNYRLLVTANLGGGVQKAVALFLSAPF